MLYIANQLRNPQAAAALLDKTEAAILERLPYAESFEQYRSLCERKYPYYRIYVDNFAIYYVVIKDTMEVHRFLYKGQNRDEKI